MGTMKAMTALAGALAVAFPVAAWGVLGSESGACPAIPLPQGREPVVLDPAQFTTRIDNPYWPMEPGSRWVYRETAPDGTRNRVVVTVTARTKLIENGITARVVRDVVTDHGEAVEVTDDWYAQDCAGNIWYLGEKTAEYKNGKLVSREGSWEAGVDGAQPGIALPADPQVGMTYRQEYYAGHAEDAGEVFSRDEQVGVPAGHFGNIVMTRDTTALHPRVLEYKFYARGVGPVLELGISGGNDRADLLSYRLGR